MRLLLFYALLLFSLAGFAQPVITLSGSYNGTLTVSEPACIPTSLTPSPLTLSVPDVPGKIYKWHFGFYGNAGNNWNIIPAQTIPPFTFTGNVLTITSFNNQPANIQLIEVTTSECTQTVYNYVVSRILLHPQLITFDKTCVTAGASFLASLSNSGPTKASLNYPDWTGPAGWTFSVNQAFGTTLINTPIATQPGAYTISVKFNNICNTSTVMNYTIYILPADIIVQASAQCFLANSNGNTLTYTTAPVNNCPDCWSFSTLPVNTALTANGNVAVFDIAQTPIVVSANFTLASGCVKSLTTPVKLNGLAPVASMLNCTGNSPGSYANINVTNYPGFGDYNIDWVSGPDIFSDVAGQHFTANNSGIISVPVNNSCDGGPITTNGSVYSLVHNGDCGIPSAPSNITIKIEPPFKITPGLFINNGTGVLSGTLYTDNPSLNYTWTTCSNPAISYPGPFINVMLEDQAVQDTYIAETSFNGCRYRQKVRFDPYYISGRAQMISDKNTSLPGNIGRVHPIPNNGNFIISLKKMKNKAAAIIYNQDGRVVKQIESLILGENKISGLRVAAGEYYIFLMIDHKTYFTKLVIQND